MMFLFPMHNKMLRDDLDRITDRHIANLDRIDKEEAERKQAVYEATPKPQDLLKAWPRRDEWRCNVVVTTGDHIKGDGVVKAIGGGEPKFADGYSSVITFVKGK